MGRSKEVSIHQQARVMEAHFRETEVAFASALFPEIVVVRRVGPSMELSTKVAEIHTRCVSL